MQTFSFCLSAFRFCYAAVFVLTLLSCRSDGELEPMTVQWSPWHFWYLGEWKLFETLGEALHLLLKAAKQLAFFYIFKVASCWNEFAHWSVLSGYKFWKPTLCNAVVHPWEIILISTSKRNSAFKNKGSFNSDGQLCASVRLWRWSTAAVEISKALFDATVRLCSLCHGSSQQVSSGACLCLRWFWKICLCIALFCPLDTRLASAIYYFHIFSIFSPWME